MQAIHKRRNNKKLIYIIYSIFIISLLNICFINFNSVFAANSSTFDANITIKPSLTLDISSSKISMELNPSSKTYDEQDLTVSVGTNNSYGYKLYLTTSGTDLVNIADNTKTIATLLNSNDGKGYTIEELTPNYWGYRLTSNSTVSSGNYFPFSNNLIVSSSDGPVNSNTTTLGFASKIDYTKPSGTYELTLNFKALPIVTQTYMQNMDPTLCTEDPTVVIDNRDNQTYTVQRLKDGKCWMMTNLNLGAYDLETDLTSANTNLATTIPATTFNEWRKTATANLYTDGEYIPITTTTSSNGLDTDPATNTKYGVLYNYCATSARTSCVRYDAINISYDICPAGWRLPTGTPNGEFTTLYNFYNSYNAMHDSFYEGDAAFTLAGYFAEGQTFSNKPEGQGQYGLYWSSDIYTTDNKVNPVYRLQLGTNDFSVYPSDHSDKRADGHSIRCILK